MQPETLKCEYQDPEGSTWTTVNVTAGDDLSTVHTLDHGASGQELPTQTKRRLQAKQLACHSLILKRFPYLRTWWEVIHEALLARMDRVQWDEEQAKQKREKSVEA